MSLVLGRELRNHGRQFAQLRRLKQVRFAQHPLRDAPLQVHLNQQRRPRLPLRDFLKVPTSAVNPSADWIIVDGFQGLN